MKFLLLTATIFASTLAFGQNALFSNSKNWKLYNIMDENAFGYPIDTLKNFAYKELNNDTIKFLFANMSELSPDSPHIWMGAYVATFEYNGETRKIEISQYGGMMYDETSKRHYQIDKAKIDDWLSYIRQSFMAIKRHKQPNE